jgi:hypothetical protein
MSALAGLCRNMVLSLIIMGLQSGDAPSQENALLNKERYAHSHVENYNQHPW